MHVTDDWLLERTGVHRSTVARWRATGKYPAAVRRLAALERGELELLCFHWAGWRLDVREGVLVSPEGERYTPGVIRALALRSQQVGALQRQLETKPVGFAQAMHALRAFFIS